MLLVWNLGRKGHFSAENHWGVEATAIYWHYVDLVWVFFYPADLSDRRGHPCRGA